MIGVTKNNPITEGGHFLGVERFDACLSSYRHKDRGFYNRSRGNKKPKPGLIFLAGFKYLKPKHQELRSGLKLGDG